VPLSVAALGLFGTCYMTMFTSSNSMLVAASDDEYRGRVMGVFIMCSVGAIPINSLVAGALASVIGPATTVLMCGIALTGFNVLFYASGSLAVIRGATAAPAT
jgi:MFS family permease